MKTKTNIAAVGKPYPNMQESLPSCRNPLRVPLPELADTAKEVRASISRAVGDIHGQINKLENALEGLQEELAPVLAPLDLTHNPNCVEDPNAESHPPLLAQIESANRRIEGVIRHVEHLRTRNQL